MCIPPSWRPACPPASFCCGAAWPSCPPGCGGGLLFIAFGVLFLLVAALYGRVVHVGPSGVRWTLLGRELRSRTWEQIGEMMNSGLVEFQSHSYDLHKNGGNAQRKGIGKRKGESTEAYQAAIREDIETGQTRFVEMTGYAPTAFTYPFGKVSEDSYSVLEELGFRASLDAQGKVFHLTRDPECLRRIPRYNRPWGKTAEQIITKAFR